MEVIVNGALIGAILGIIFGFFALHKDFRYNKPFFAKGMFFSIILFMFIGISINYCGGPSNSDKGMTLMPGRWSDWK